MSVGHFVQFRSELLLSYRAKIKLFMSERKEMKILSFVIFSILCVPAMAENFIIEMLNKDANGNKMVYSEQIIMVDVGDTVTWLPTSKGHNVEMIASPNRLKYKSKPNKKAEITFDTPGIYYYWCTPHKGMGMIGLVVVGNDFSNRNQIAKAKAFGKTKKKLKKLVESLG